MSESVNLERVVKFSGILRQEASLKVGKGEDKNSYWIQIIGVGNNRDKYRDVARVVVGAGYKPGEVVKFEVRIPIRA